MRAGIPVRVSGEMAGDKSGRKHKLKEKAPEMPAVRKVFPAIPEADADKKVLRHYLEIMGCLGLLKVPWGGKNPELLAELMGTPDNRFDGLLRAHPEKWTATEWRRTYGFREGEVRVLERREELMEEEFVRPSDPKDGYTVEDLRDPHAQIVIGFVNPIFHPDKPKTLVNKWAGIFLGAMRGKLKVDWAMLMSDMVDHLVKDLPKMKKAGSPLPTYLSHLYARYEILTPDEQDEYNDQLEIMAYGGPDADEDEESDQPDTPESPPAGPSLTRKRSKPDRPAPVPAPAPVPERAPAGPSNPELEAEDPDRVQEARRQGRIPTPTLPELTGQPGADIIEMMQHVLWRAMYMNQSIADRSIILREVVDELNVDTFEEIGPRIRDLKRMQVRLEITKGQHAMITQVAARLRKELDAEVAAHAEERKARELAEQRANESARALVEVRDALNFPVDTVNRSILFTAGLEKEDRMTRGQMIKFLLEHGRKMERTWEKMQLL